MAISSSVVLAGANTYSADVTATADADTTLAIPHGLPSEPSVPIISPITANQAAAAVSGWAVNSDAVNVNVIKGTGVGSGAAGAQLRVTVTTPHSLTR